MDLLVDLFGFLTVILRGCALALMACTIGGVVFRHAVFNPLHVDTSGVAGAIGPRLGRIQWIAALALALVIMLATSLDLTVLIATIGVSWVAALTAPFALAGAATCAVALILALTARLTRVNPWFEGLGALLLLGSIVATTHAVGRIDARAALLGASALHQAGGAMWLGGLPYFLLTLGATLPLAARAALARRYSHVCVVGVVAILVSAAFKYINYLGVFAATYGTAYGIMTSTKVVLFGALLGFGAGNFWAVRRMANDDKAALRTRRFVEVELVLGLTVFFVAGSLTSQPPAIDLPHDRVAWHTIVDRVLTPRAPRLVSPDISETWYAVEQARQQQLVETERAAAVRAFIPGSGWSAPSTAGDLAWSEYNHNWSGIFVLSIGLLALLAHTPYLPWTRHWPLVFVALAVFLTIRSDPETWPLGEISFFASLRDPTVIQHRFMAMLVAVFGFFEWRVRNGSLAGTRAAYVFPISNIVGGIMLLTHSHNLENIQEALLIELSHIPLGLFAIAGGCSRWLELRCGSPIRERAAWIWPLCFIAIGLILLAYRES